MTEFLHREEIPIQPVVEENGRMFVAIPVHNQIQRLPTEVRQDHLDLSDARRVVSEWYDEDIDWLVRTTEERSDRRPEFKGARVFGSDWQLDAGPDSTGYLTLTIEDEKRRTSIGFDTIQDVFRNRVNAAGKFITPAIMRQDRTFPMFTISNMDGTVVLMEPEKMKQYGQENDFDAGLNRFTGAVTVIGNSFRSPYLGKITTAIALRNFGVYYLNKLAEQVPEE